MAKLHRTIAVAAALLLVAACTGDSKPDEFGIDVDAEWVQVDDATMDGRYNAAFVELPDGALVVGGTADVSCPPPNDCFQVEPEDPIVSGARYHADDGSWTPIADAPARLMPWTPRAVVGDRVFFWTPERNGLPTDEIAFAPDDFIAYNLASDSWESFDPPPAKPFSEFGLVGVGDRLLAAQSTNAVWRGGDWFLDPETGEWDPLPADPMDVSYSRQFVVGDDELYLFQTSREDEEPRLVQGAVFDVAAATWTKLPDSEQLRAPSGVVGGVLVHPRFDTMDGGIVNGWERPYPLGGIYDPAADEWRGLPNPPAGEGVFAAAVIAAEGQLVQHYRGDWVLHFDSATWHTMPELDEQRLANDDDWFQGAAYGWAGDGLLVVGGVIWEESGGKLTNDAWIWRPRPGS